MPNRSQPASKDRLNALLKLCPAPDLPCLGRRGERNRAFEKPIFNTPARYCTGSLGSLGCLGCLGDIGDIGMPPENVPMDFAAWFEAYLGDRCYTFDARNNTPRIGRVPMAHGRDACNVALASTFGPNILQRFRVWADKVPQG